MSAEVDPFWWAPIAFFAGLFLVILVATYRWERRQVRYVVPGSAARAMALIQEYIDPTLLLTPSERDVFSKLGGRPNLPSDLVWPTAYEGARTFVAQLDFAEMPASGRPDWLPREGRIFLFYDPDSNGCADLVSVVHHHGPPGPAAAPPQMPWAEFRERQVAFEPRTSAASLEWLNIDVNILDADYEEFSDDLWQQITAPPPDACQHRIGGYPNEIQDACLRHECELISRGLPPDTVIDEQLEDASLEWRLLIQVDSDTDLKMEWHDGGRLYVFVRETDARAGDFSKTVTILQSY